MSIPNILKRKVCVPNNNLPKVVVIGAGFAGINLIKSLKNKPVQIILLDANNFHQFQPLLYQVAISGLEPDSIVTPVRKLFHGYRNLIYRMTRVEYIDTGQNAVQTDIGMVDYDFLVIATGSSTNFFGSKTIEQNSIGLKNIQNALDIRSWILQNLEKAVENCSNEVKKELTTFVIVGGGPAGVEMAGAIAEFKRYLLKRDYPEIVNDWMKIYLVQAGDRILPAMSEKASRYALDKLSALDVDVMMDTFVTNYDGKNVLLNDGEIIRTNTVIWTAGVKGNSLKGIDASCIVRGDRIKVNSYNLVEGLDNVFAIGDVSAMISEEYPAGHPMVAQAAIQQGKMLARNLLGFLKQGSFDHAFEYHDKGSMATIGKNNAVADLNSIYLNDRLGWLLWSFVHLISITGFNNKLLVAFNWIIKYFRYEKSNQLIIRKYEPGKNGR